MHLLIDTMALWTELSVYQCASVYWNTVSSSFKYETQHGIARSHGVYVFYLLRNKMCFVTFLSNKLLHHKDN